MKAPAIERAALGAVAGGTALVAVAYASAWLGQVAPAWGVLCMIGGSALLLAAVAVLGALRSGVRRSLAIGAGVALFVIIAGGFAAPLWLPAESADGPLFLGLPLRAAVEIYGVGLLPLLVLPLLYAGEFRAAGLDDASLRALRERCAAVRGRLTSADEG